MKNILTQKGKNRFFKFNVFFFNLLGFLPVTITETKLQPSNLLRLYNAVLIVICFSYVPVIAGNFPKFKINEPIFDATVIFGILLGKLGWISIHLLVEKSFLGIA